MKCFNIKKIIQKSLFYKIYVQSSGNILYPLILLRWWLVKLLSPRKKIKINGLSFTLSCENWITHFRWYLFKSKEPETIHFLDEYLKEDDIFFDIGANVGVFSLYASKKIDKIKVYSFEPEISNLSILKENIIKNNVKDKIHLYSTALSNINGLSKLHLQDLTPGSALHTENINNINISAEGNNPIILKEGIYSVTLDSFCKELNVIPNVIKIDTDGNEEKILIGANEILKNSMLKALIIEMPDNENNQCESLLLNAGLTKRKYDFEQSRNEIWSR